MIYQLCSVSFNSKRGYTATRSAMPREKGREGKGREAVPLQIRTATPSSIRAVNRSIILELIRRRQPVSRAELARRVPPYRNCNSRACRCAHWPRILWMHTHKELSGFPIADEIEAHTGIETVADNDCN